MNNGSLHDARLFDALEYVDERFIAEITDKYESLGGIGEPTMTKKAKRRYYTKVAMLAACVVLFAGFIMALPKMLHDIIYPEPGGTVVTEDPVEDILTEEDLVMINEFFASVYHDPSYVWAGSVEEAMASPHFFGKYGDCYILFADAQTQILSSWIVGGYLFATSDGYIVLYEGNAYTLLDAYEKGMLNDGHIERLSTLRSRKPEAPLGVSYIGEDKYICQTSVPVSLSSEEISNIVHAYFRYRLELSSSYQNDSLFSVRCFGKYGDIYAVTVDQFSFNEGGTGNAGTLTIDGVDFIAPYAGDLRIYKDGRLYYYLSDAVSEGIVDHDLLKQIAHDFNKSIDLYPAKAYVELSGIDIYDDFDLTKLRVAIMPFADASKYTAADFSEVGCIAVEPLSEELPISGYDGMTAKQLVITLSSKSKQELIDAYETLRMRSDIYSVSAYMIEIMYSKDFIARYIDDSYEYYGKYGYCHVRYPISENTSATGETVGSYTFEYPNGAAIEVYYIDKFYSLSQAYENVYLTDSDLEKLYLYHTKAKHIDASYYEESGKVYDHHGAKLAAYEYLKDKDASYRDKKYTVADVYTDVQGASAVFIWYEGENITVGEWSETAHGVTFDYKDSRRMYILKDGKAMTVPEAAELYSSSEISWYNIREWLKYRFDYGDM